MGPQRRGADMSPFNPQRFRRTVEGEVCPRCGRTIHPWPLFHRACAPKEWVHCIKTHVPAERTRSEEVKA